MITSGDTLKMINSGDTLKIITSGDTLKKKNIMGKNYVPKYETIENKYPPPGDPRGGHRGPGEGAGLQQEGWLSDGARGEGGFSVTPL